MRVKWLRKTVGQAVAFPPQRGWGTHGPSGNAQGREERAAVPGQERGVHGRGSGETMEDHWAPTTYNTAPYTK